MGRIDIRLRAIEDLSEISDYTLEKWGAEQAESYLNGIDRAFECLAENPKIGHACDQIREGYSKHRTGSHVIFYRAVSTGIEVVRVLHQSMDFRRHL